MRIVDNQHENQLLTVVVPVSRMYGRMQNLFLWLNEVNDHECEVIIVHDMQDTQTSEELQNQLQKLDSPKVRFLEGRFGSPGLARNFGKQYAAGTHIMFCDSDDVLQLSKALETIAKEPRPSVIIGSYLTVNSQSNQQRERHKAPGNVLQLAKSPGIWRFIFKSEVIKGIDFKDYRMGEDQLFLAQVGIFSQDVLRVNETLYHYFTNNKDQLTSQKGNISDLIGVIRDVRDLEIQVCGQNKTFAKLLIVKNCLTILKNSRTLMRNSKTSAITYISQQAIRASFTLNWTRALRFKGKEK
jgi:glycosyltransferase involved in cell wall biosynthesis